jgi:hypothetical protein
VFAIMCAIIPGPIGWICYFVAIAQYLLIGLVTSRDKALDVLAQFDRQVAVRRREIIREFNLGMPAESETTHKRASENPHPAQPAPHDGAPGESAVGNVANEPNAGYLSD